MSATKLRLPVAIENAIGVTLSDGTPASYVQSRYHGGPDKLAHLLGGSVLFDSYKQWPADADERCKLMDAFFGPGYWLQGDPLDDKGRPTKPPREGRRLLVVTGINLRTLGWQEDERGGGPRCEVAADGVGKDALLASLPADVRATARDAEPDEEPPKAAKLERPAKTLAVEVVR